MSRTNRCHLLELPAEIRNQVFKLLFHEARISFRNTTPMGGTVLSIPSAQNILLKFNRPEVDMRWEMKRHNLHVSILQTCRRLRNEAMSMFWDTFYLQIQARMLHDFRNVGLWSHSRLRRMLSLKPQIWNISVEIATRELQSYYLALFTCFVRDFRHYASLKRCVLDVQEFDVARSPFRAIPSEEVYRDRTRTERAVFWNSLRSIPFVQQCTGLKGEAKMDPGWDPIYALLMFWRADPWVAGRFDGSENQDNANGMSFDIIFRSTAQAKYPQLPRLDSDGDTDGEDGVLKASYGYLPPLGYEAKVVARDEHFRRLEYTDIRPLNSGSAFWMSEEPPEYYVDYGKVDCTNRRWLK